MESLLQTYRWVSPTHKSMSESKSSTGSTQCNLKVCARVGSFARINRHPMPAWPKTLDANSRAGVTDIKTQHPIFSLNPTYDRAILMVGKSVTATFNHYVVCFDHMTGLPDSDWLKSVITLPCDNTPVVRLWCFGADLVKLQYLCRFSWDVNVLHIK